MIVVEYGEGEETHYILVSDEYMRISPNFTDLRLLEDWVMDNLLDGEESFEIVRSNKYIEEPELQ